jgi:hypothetical protein
VGKTEFHLLIGLTLGILYTLIEKGTLDNRLKIELEVSRLDYQKIRSQER